MSKEWEVLQQWMWTSLCGSKCRYLFYFLFVFLVSKLFIPYRDISKLKMNNTLKCHVELLKWGSNNIWWMETFSIQWHALSCVCLTAKPGECPLEKLVGGSCDKSCTCDSNCPKNEKCCSNGCGHHCATPCTGIYIIVYGSLFSTWCQK